ncbi:L,D-transpeptidase family protein [uncultured Clostridium sp.]|uniref:L,D-transpeptidase family protein n=1 Tax=uncultured Clostridium sp. TaxID=59620 RepID=UPI0028EC605B|nr:L,D-transpeptidase family protein [uncultured Clostridium sp.]
MEKEINNYNKFISKCLATFLSLILTLSILFINTTNVYAKTLSSASDDEYVLKLIQRGGTTEEIKGKDINLKFNSTDAITISYDEQLLKQCIDNLHCLNPANVTEPQSSKLEYRNYDYIITPEVIGSKLNKETLYNNVVSAIKNQEIELNLETAGCYERPKYTANSPTMIYAADTINKYLASNITYNYAGMAQVVDKYKIIDWISTDSNFSIILDESKVRSFVEGLASSYRNSLGTSIKVGGGYSGNNHGWAINVDTETTELINLIKSGQTVTKNPTYYQTSVASYFNNASDTFVEIDMTNQHLWFYKNGYLVVQSDIVTGNMSAGYATPSGTYKLYYKQKDTVLRGPGYASPVSFWMPFNGGIGLHDATWRSEFGGEIYKNGGSHGCINLPYSTAKSIYDNITPKTTIICYY